MTKEEITARLKDLEKEENDIIERRAKLYDERDAYVEKIYPFETWEKEIRKVQEEKRVLEKNLSEEENRALFMEMIQERMKNYNPENLRGNLPVDIPVNNDLARELQDRLVQTCIDFILEKKDYTIYSVEFNADSLQESAIHGKWDVSTDSYLGLKGMIWDKENKIPVTKEIGESF